MSLFASRTPSLGLGSLPRVDLLPPSEVRRRAAAARARMWLFVGVGALAVSALAVGGAFTFNMTAGIRLASEQSVTQNLLVGIAEMSDVSQAMALRTELAATADEAMAGDLRWSAVLDTVESRLPDGVVVTDYALTAGAVPDAAIESSDAVGAMGTVTVASLTAVPLVQLTRTVRDVPSVEWAEVDELFRDADDPLFEYRIRIAVDQSVYVVTATDGTGTP